MILTRFTMSLLKFSLLLTFFTLTFASRIAFISETKHALHGDTVTLECAAEKRDDEAVMWLLKGNSSNQVDSKIIAIEGKLGDANSDYKMYVASVDFKEFKEKKLPHYSFTINKVTKKDEGTYICSIIGGHSTIMSKVNLNVHEPVQIMIKGNQTVEVREGEKVSIDCYGVRGDPKPTVAWNYHKSLNGLWQNETSKDAFKSYKSTLEFAVINRRQAGTYNCTAMNAYSSATDSIDIHVKFAPTVKVIWPVRHSNPEDRVQLVCQVLGYPKPKVSWFKGERKIALFENSYRPYSMDLIEINEQLSSAVLKIRKYKDTEEMKEYFGNYTCRAENELGKVEKVVQFVQ